jgi:hypothetical protein
MGGLGSGRPAAHTRPVEEDIPTILVSELYGKKAPGPGPPVVREWRLAGGAKQVLLMLRLETDSGDQVDCRSNRTARDGTIIEEAHFQIAVEWTPCNYGGRRARLRCPRESCERPVRKLYLQGMHLVCRSCAGLKYASQRQRPQERRLARIEAIRARLGPNIRGVPSWPPGMGRAEYLRLHAQLDNVFLRFLEEAGEELARLEAHARKLSKS